MLSARLLGRVVWPDRPTESTRPTCDGDMGGFPIKGPYMLFFPPGTPFGVTTPLSCCIATVSCTGVASDQFPLLAMQGQAYDGFALAPSLVDVP